MSATASAVWKDDSGDEIRIEWRGEMTVLCAMVGSGEDPLDQLRSAVPDDGPVELFLLLRKTPTK